MEQFVVYTNQSILYGITGRSGLVTGRSRGSGRYSILYDWLVPNRNAKQYIGISLVRGSGVLRTKGLECGGNGCIILGGAACVDALVCFTGLLAACGGVVPTAV